MPRLETEITELSTGLGALGYDLASGLRRPPAQIVNVRSGTWERLRDAYELDGHRDLFQVAWENGRALLLAADGLRGRLPTRVEWKGPDRQVEQDPIPADLRIDYVFLISIKSRSAVLWNRSPAQVFLRQASRHHWYVETALEEYQALYDEARDLVELDDLPLDVSGLSRREGATIARRLPDRQWPEPLADPYRRLARRCAIRSAELWNDAVATPAARERTAWWLLRLAPAPYYLLGDSTSASLRIRVDTPWDWRQSWEFLDLEISPALDAGQPQVDWTIRSRHRGSGQIRHTSGYVEIRWSHGRFSGNPEAKVQLRARHEDVPGYTPLT